VLVATFDWLFLHRWQATDFSYTGDNPLTFLTHVTCHWPFLHRWQATDFPFTGDMPLTFLSQVTCHWLSFHRWQAIDFPFTGDKPLTFLSQVTSHLSVSSVIRSLQEDEVWRNISGCTQVWCLYFYLFILFCMQFKKNIILVWITYIDALWLVITKWTRKWIWDFLQ